MAAAADIGRLVRFNSVRRRHVRNCRSPRLAGIIARSASHETGGGGGGGAER